MSGIINGAGSKSGVIGQTELEYEEGDWTPIMADTNDGNQMTHNLQEASYRKVGKMVFIAGIVNSTNVSSASGAIRMQGFPFSPAAGREALSCINVGYSGGFAITAGNTVCFRVAQTDGLANLHKWSSTEGTSSMTHSEWTNDGEAQFGGFYLTDS